MSKTSDFKKCCKGLTKEQVEAKLKERAIRREIAYWRAECLRKYREMEQSGNFSPPEVV